MSRGRADGGEGDAAGVARFFDRQAEQYHRPEGMGMGPYHVLTAAHLEEHLAGRIVAVGGLWNAASRERCSEMDLTVVDLSEQMLEPARAAGFTTVVADARTLPFEDRSVDALVFPLILHHITGGGFRRSHLELGHVMAEAHRVLRPGGRIWISDFLVGTGVYALEALAAPATKRLLRLAGIPLVVMHPKWVFQRALRRAGFTEADLFQPRPTKEHLWIYPVIGLDWLVVPRALYPITPVLISGRRAP